MVTVSAATEIILGHLFKPAITRVRLEDCTGKVLAEPVAADRDFPAFHRVSMDGIAIRYRDWEKGIRTFAKAGTQAAGREQGVLPEGEYCMEVMTGAVLPSGCDTVIRYEDVQMDEGTATVVVDKIHPWQSVHQRATDAREGEVLLEPGHCIAPSEIALLASVGKSEVDVFDFPKVAIISTGDELVDLATAPAPWQIRRSNSFALQSALRDMNGDGTCFHLKDEKSSMEKSLKKIIEQFDVLILSGGVSKGKFDFVPDVLENIGIGKLFHQVSQRPGKPFWFGAGENGKIAFALPGNPVSTFMCFYRYVRPWFLKSLGAPLEEKFAILGTDFSFANPLTCFLQVSVSYEGGKLTAFPAPGGGSGDFANLNKVSGFLELPLEKNDFKAGDVYPYIAFRR
jgi:molybdopterin molybdotransferase